MPEEEFKPQTSKEVDFSQVSYFIFDYDGTLADSREAYTQTFIELLEQDFGIDPIASREYYTTSFGKSLGAQFQEAVSKFARKEIQDTSEIESRFWELVKPKPAQLLPGAVETLENLKQAGYKIAIWTNCRSDVLEFKLKELGLANFVNFQISETVGSRDEVKGSVLFERIAKHFEIQPEVLARQAVVVGDGERDMEAAKSCNVPPIGITTSKTSEQLRNAGAKLIINQLPELLEILKR